MMKHLSRASALVALVLAVGTSRTSAGIVFTLDDVKLVSGGRDAGTLTGSFTLSDDLQTLKAVDITASAVRGDDVFGFPSVTFVLGDHTTVHADQLPNSFKLDMNVGPLGGGDHLQLVFDERLGTSGTFNLSIDSTNVTNGSYVSQMGAQARTVASGAVTAASQAPEPASFAMAAIAAGAGLAIGARRRRAGWAS